MKSIRVLTCALVACTVAASAATTANIEQVFDFSVIGWFQGVTNITGVMEHDHTTIIRISSANMVHALALDHRDDPNFTNYYRFGQLYYKTSTNGSTTNIVIRAPGRTNELDVTGAFSFSVGPFVIDQVFNTNTLFTNSYVETGLRGVSFTSSSISFTNIDSSTNLGFSTGSLTRTRKLSARINNETVSGYANQLSYTAGAGVFSLNTNAFYTTNFQFAASNLVNGPAQINFRTFAPVITPY